ncbi:MAG: hypothetical protein Q8Q60_05495 [Candidatus Chromulinivorax sp.]|nr:hypothetical protein [Candidatus Chromulinivorax sp.]
MSILLESELREQNNDRISHLKKAIYLHCAMIYAYQELHTLLDNPKFIHFFNHNFSSLLNNNSEKSNLLSSITPPNDLSVQELFFMSEFGSILSKKTQESLSIYKERAEKYSAHGNPPLIINILMGYIFLGVVTGMLWSLGLPLIAPALSGIICSSIAGALFIGLLVWGARQLYSKWLDRVHSEIDAPSKTLRRLENGEINIKSQEKFQFHNPEPDASNVAASLSKIRGSFFALSPNLVHIPSDFINQISAIK